MRLAAARRLRFWSIRELARRADISTGTLNGIELGRTTPSLNTIKKLSEVLEVDPLEIDEFRRVIMGDQSNRLAPASV
jgi:transcriptional regulator with XRE-family HTH domain